LCYCKTLKLLR